MSSWHNVFTFVVSTICSLGAMNGLIVASTINRYLHQHHGFSRPTLLMGNNAVSTARSDDLGALTTSRSPRPFVVHGINSWFFILQQQDLLLIHDHVSQQQRQSQHWRTWRHGSPTLSWYDSVAIYGRACWVYRSRFPSSSTYCNSPSASVPLLHDGCRRTGLQQQTKQQTRAVLTQAPTQSALENTVCHTV